MGATFSVAIRRALMGGGFQISSTSARQAVERDGVRLAAHLRASGEWTVHAARAGQPQAALVATGAEPHPCGGASDVLEILWSWRDGRPLPPHVWTCLTDDGRALFKELMR